MPFAASFALAVSFALGSTAPAPQAPPVPPQAQTIHEYVSAYFADIPVMIDIAKCESRFKQFDKDGSVHRGVVNDQDVGVMQINEHYHLETSTKLDIDIYTVEGNVAYAKYLYEKEGTQPWVSSSPCWNKSKNAKLLATAGK